MASVDTTLTGSGTLDTEPTVPAKVSEEPGRNKRMRKPTALDEDLIPWTALDAVDPVVLRAHSDFISDALIPEDPNSKRRQKKGKSTPGKRAAVADNRPRWLNANYLLFRALLNHPKKAMARTALINAALDLEKKLCRELGIPAVIRGKTPKNTLSACLTTNVDRCFVAFRPKKATSMHFRPAWIPGDMEAAWNSYLDWTKDLYEHDLPHIYSSWHPEIDLIKVCLYSSVA